MDHKERIAQVTDTKNNENELLTPSQYFDYVKSKKNEMTSEELKRVYSNAEALLNKAIITGQNKMIEKCKFFMKTIEMEQKVVEAGFTQYVNRWDLDEYIEKISDKSVGIIEMRNYERDFPDDVMDDIVKAKEVFDEIYVVFTDYTGKEKRKIAKERREKDPILFGAIMENDVILDRLYYITDWVDETCDLTLSELINKYDLYHKDANRTIVNVINYPKDQKEFNQMVAEVDLND